MAIFLFTVFCGVCSTAVVYLAMDVVAGQQQTERLKVQRRLNALTRKRNSTTLEEASYSSIDSLNKIFKRQRMSQKLFQLLTLSGWTMPLSVFIFADLLWGGIVFVFTFMGTKLIGPAAIAGIVAAFIPYAILNFNKKRYVQKFIFSFPDVLVMMKSALKAGQSLQGAMQIVAEEGPQPASDEFKRMIREIEVGSQITDVLQGLYNRIQTLDLRMFVVGIFIQQEVGGNLIELLEHIEVTIRERITLSRELTAATSQGKMTGFLLIGIPFFIVGSLNVINPGYFDPLFTPKYQNILYTAIGLEVLGAYIIYKMTSMDISK